MSFTSGGSSFVFSGSIEALEQSSATVAVAQIGTTQTFAVDALTSTGVGIGGGAAVGVDGATLTPNSIALIDPPGGDTADSYVMLQGTLGFSELPGLSVPVSGTNNAQISPAAAAPGLTLVAASTTSPFELSGLDLTPSSTTGPGSFSVGYSTGSGAFQVSGSIAVAATTTGDFSGSGSLGTTSTPGLVIDDTGAVTELSVTISGDITVQGLGISATANDLQLVYQVNSANPIYDGDFLIEQGSVTIATSADDTSFSATFGATIDGVTNPGLILDQGSLAGLYATVSSTISVQGLTVYAGGLVFQYEGSNDLFEIATGSVSISSGTLQFSSASFGDSGTPGLSIEDGVLTEFDIAISTSLTVDGMSLTVDQVQLVYQAVPDQTDGNFQIAGGGSISLSTGPDDNVLSFSGTFGTTQGTPGLSMTDGVLQSFYIAISSNSNIGLGGSLTLTVTTTDLAFTYVSADQTFQIPSGSLSVADTSGDFSFTGTFGTTTGDTTTPGLVVSDGALTGLNATITSQMVAGDLTFSVSDLDFSYSASANEYEIATGALSFDTSEGFSFSATLGLLDPSDSSTELPGLVISGGALTEFNAALTLNFDVAGLVITVNDMAMSYTGTDDYAMYGTVTVDTTDVQFTGTIGTPDASPPGYGLIIDANTLESLAITINGTVTFGSLSLTADNLAFNYDAAPESFTLYGSVTTSIAGVTLDGNLGTQSDPGLSIVNGQLAALNLGVSTDFTLFDLTCDIQDLTFQYQSTEGNVDYVLFGTLTVSVSSNTLSATMGSASDPGLIIQNGDLTQINMAITGSFGISGFEFAIQDAGLDYTATTDAYLVFGTFTLSDVFSASVQLGTGSSNPGITIIDGVFQLDNFAFSLDNVPIGAFTLNYVDISYASAGDVWSGAASVTFPTGWAIAASMTFVDGLLDDISLSYNAGTSTGIPISDTGVYVTEMSGSLQNLDEPPNIIVSGTIQAVFGKQISIGGTSCAIFAATGSFTADSQELVISGDYYEGAYQSGGNWHDVLGGGSATVTLDWATGDYTASVSESLYEGIFVISAEIAFDDSGNLGINASATVEVPKSVPFIGGTKLGSMNFAFIFNASSDTGTVSAWVSINVFFAKITTGFEYNFNSGSSESFALIGGGAVNSIENSFNSIASSDTNTPPVYVYTYSVTVSASSGENGLSVQASWPENLGTQNLLISGPSDNGTFYAATTSGLPADDEFLTSYTTSTSQSVLTVGSSTSTSVALSAGTYTFEVQSTYEFPSTSDVVFTNQLYYESPTVSITSVPTSALAFVPTMTGFAAGALAADTTITLYASTSNSGYQGKEVGSFDYSVNASGQLENVPTINLSSYAPGVPITIYATINDGTDPVVYSTVSPAITPVPNLVGQVTDQFGNPIAGMRIFLDLNDDQTYDAPQYNASGVLTQAGDPSVITNSDGEYYFNDLANDATTDVGYPTFNVMAVMPSPSFTPITPANDVDQVSESDITATSGTATQSLSADFEVQRLASISGSLYSDLAQDGIDSASDPALGGVTVYLDSTGTGVYQAGDPTCVAGPSGTFAFYGLTTGATYDVGIITSSTVNGVTTPLYVVTGPSSGIYSIPITSNAQQLTGYAFGVVSLATISGTVSTQGSGGSSSSPNSGTSVVISTPNQSASAPNYGSFSSTAGLDLIGSSASSSTGLVLLGSGDSGPSTAAWYATPIPISGGFQTSFQWTMTSADGGAGGFAFVVQSSGTSATGSSAYGYGGLAPSVAVVFDAADNELLIESGGNTSAAGALAVLTSEELGFALDSGTTYTTRITDLPTSASGTGTMEIYISGDSTGGLTPAITVSLNLASLLDLGSSGGAVAGFTAGSPGAGLAASIASWTLNALTTQWTTTDSQGNYSLTGLMPQTSYTVSEVTPTGSIQSSPSSTQGVFSQLSLSALGTVASSVATGDFNGDGIPDVAYAISLSAGSPYEIAYAYGNGNGGFDTPVLVTIPVPAGAPALATPADGSAAFDAHLAAGDFDNTSRDQVAYIATMATGGDVVVVYDILTNNVLNLFEIESSQVAPAQVSTVVPDNAGTINNVAVGDLNNDGYDDLAVSTYGGVYTIVSLQNLQSTTTWTVNPSTVAYPFGTPSLLYANGTSGNTNGTAYNAGVAIADFNGDGILDLVTVGVDYIPVVTMDHYGTVDSWSDMTVATTIQLADGTGNGLDYTTQPQLTLQLFTESDIDQYFSSTDSSPDYPLPVGLATPDINGDGVPDLVLNGYTDDLQPGVIALVQNGGNFADAGTFLFPNGKSFNVNNTFGDNVAVAGSSLLAAQVAGIDLNGDGYDDIAAIDPNVGQMMLLTSSAAPLTNGQTQTMIEFAGGALPQFAVADFSMDGYPDLVVPGANAYPSQSAPAMILNGTVNSGAITYTPANGQTLGGQDFSNFGFESSTVEPDAIVQGAVPAAAAPADGIAIAGRVYVDQNMNGRYNAGETGLAGVTVYIDNDHNGTFDPAHDPSTTTNAQGYYSLPGLLPGAIYDIALADLPGSYTASEVAVQTPARSASGIVERYLAASELWSVAQPTTSVDPLTPIAIELAPLSRRESLGLRPKYELVGTVPSGMTIDPYTGEILWTAPDSYSGQTVPVDVRIRDASSPGSSASQTNEFQIQVASLSPMAAYIRDVFGALLDRLPTADELAEWLARLQSGTSFLSFVSAIAHSQERYSILIDQVYLNLLSTEPTPAQASAATAMLESGGNSDILTRQLLVSPTFIGLHPTNTEYVNAVNEVLLFRQNTRAMTRREVTWLRKGMSRARLVALIFHSHTATMAKARQLSEEYLGGPSSQKMLNEWATALSRGTLNSDSLTTQILASHLYESGWSWRVVPNIQPAGTISSPQYNKLDHLAFTVTGADATRSELDSMEKSMYDGGSWRNLAADVYNGQSAAEFRIQTQYRNLLRRDATESEMSEMMATLPEANQTQTLQIQILSGSEYRAEFSRTASYVASVFQVLTGAPPQPGVASSWTDRLDHGLAPGKFVHSVASSNAGRSGQVARIYGEFLGRAPSPKETRSILASYGSAALRDRPIALQLMTTSEFKLSNKPASLLAVDAGTP